jgi:hypothetical protein
MVKNLNTVDQGRNVRHGHQAGYQNQGDSAVAVGEGAGSTSQGTNAVAIGKNAGANSQGISSIAVGTHSANNTQGDNSIAMGTYSSFTQQGNNCISIGGASGQTTQGDSAIAIGTSSARINQGQLAIAIGGDAGRSNQGDYSIAIGHKAGYSNQNTKTIILNATNTELNANNTGAFYVKPIRFLDTLNANVLTYIPETGEVVDSNAITFRAGSTLVGINNSNPTHTLDVGQHLSVDNSGGTTNVLTVRGGVEATGNLTVKGNMIAKKIELSDDMVIRGNLHVHGTETIVNTEKILVKDPIIELANNIDDGNQDVGIIMRRPNGDPSVFIGYHGDSKTDRGLSIGYTKSDVHSKSLLVENNEYIPVNIHGSLKVGEVLTVDKEASNVVEVTGNVNATEHLMAPHVVAHTDLKVGDLLEVDTKSDTLTLRGTAKIDDIEVGNLHIHGTTTTIHTEKLEVRDPIIGIGSGAGADKLGILLETPSGKPNVFAGYLNDTYQLGLTDSGIHGDITINEDSNLPVKINGTLEFSDGARVSGIKYETFPVSNILSYTGTGEIVQSDHIQFKNTILPGNVNIPSTEINNGLIVNRYVPPAKIYLNVITNDNSNLIQISDIFSVNDSRPHTVEVLGNVNATDSLLASHLVAHTDLKVGGVLTVDSNQNITGNNISGTSSNIGKDTVAIGDNSHASGIGTQANTFGECVVGTYNQLFPNRNGHKNVSELYDVDNAFVVGVGKSQNERKNGLTVKKDGKVGIGTNYPDHLLDVIGKIYADSIETGLAQIETIEAINMLAFGKIEAANMVATGKIEAPNMVATGTIEAPNMVASGTIEATNIEVDGTIEAKDGGSMKAPWVRIIGDSTGFSNRLVGGVPDATENGYAQLEISSKDAEQKVGEDFHRGYIKFGYDHRAAGNRGCGFIQGVVANTYKDVPLCLCPMGGMVGIGVNDPDIINPDGGIDSDVKLYVEGDMKLKGDLEVTGDIWFGGRLDTSDDRLKHNEESVVDALTTLDKLKLQKYDKTTKMLDADYNGDLSNLTHHTEIGFIAQEVKEIPELAHVVHEPRSESDPYSVNYNDIHNLGIQGIQELYSKYKALLERVEALERK